jgi:protein JBTS26
MPEGFTFTFIIHNSWGDRFFVGLNGIEIFNDRGEVITTQNLGQIRADPSSLSKLTGYEGDKRVVGNLINGNNTTTADNSIWLTPLLSDVERIEKGRPNIIILDYTKSSKISGINFYNYTKTPERGVREIEIYLDNYLLYRVPFLSSLGLSSQIRSSAGNHPHDDKFHEGAEPAGGYEL